jgi:hypothetical protein
MFGLIFMWTPPHFWALALFMKSDYHEAKVPMLTVTHGRAETRRQIWIYSLLLAPVALGLALTSIGGAGLPGRRRGAERDLPEARLRRLAPRRGHGRGGQLRRRKAPLPLLAELSFPAFRRAAGRCRIAPDGVLGG